MTGPLALSPLETLLRMSPLACAQALLAALLTGELSAATSLITGSADDVGVGGGPAALPLVLPFLPLPLPRPSLALALVGNGALAFVLNVSSFATNRAAGALTMTVCGNVKQCLTVLLGVLLFGVRVGCTNGVGMIVALAGAAWYSAVEIAGNGQKEKARERGRE